MPSCRDAHLRHAIHYANVLHAANVIYQSREKPIEGLTLLWEEFSNIERARHWAEQHANDFEPAAQLCLLYPVIGAFILDKHQHPLQRIQWLEIALSHLSRSPEVVPASSLFVALGRAHDLMGRTTEAIPFYQEILTESRAISDRDAELSAVSNLGVAYFHIGQSAAAIECEERALTLSRELGYREAESQIIGDLGNVHYLMGDYVRAADLYDQRLKIAIDIGDKRGESGALLSLGLTYMKQMKWSEAIEVYKQALSISRKLGDLRAEGEVLGNLSSAHIVLGKTEESMQISDRRLEIAREVGDRRGEGKALYNRAVLEREYGDNERAIVFAESALAILNSTGDAYLDKIRSELDEWRKEPAKSASVAPELELLLNRRLQLSQEYQEQMERWNSLPWWKRLFTKKPALPRELLYDDIN